MAYVKPDGFLQKLFNKVALLIGYGGSVALLVKGRKSGAWQKVPVIPLQFEGNRYLISVRGESEWVRNVRAAGGCRLEKGRKVEEVRATEVDVFDRSPIITAFRKTAEPRSVIDDVWATLPDPADHPVFRLEPGSPQGA